MASSIELNMWAWEAKSSGAHTTTFFSHCFGRKVENKTENEFISGATDVPETRLVLGFSCVRFGI